MLSLVALKVSFETGNLSQRRILLYIALWTMKENDFTIAYLFVSLYVFIRDIAAPFNNDLCLDAKKLSPL